jgi:hypothetical protein
MIRRTAAGVFILLFVATSVHFAAAQDTARWKRYQNSEYVFEIAYPPDWLFDDGYQNNYGKPPSAGQGPPMPGKPTTCLVWRWTVQTSRTKEEVLSTTAR